MSRIKSVIKSKIADSNEPIELFSTAEGIRAVDSPVRVKIIAMLKEREMPFDEIVERTGRAKSTISVHLNDMTMEGIIGAKLDTRDRRKKIFFIDASYLGGLKNDRILEEDINDILSRKGMPDIVDFFKIMFRSIRVELCLQGVNIDPMLSDAGYRVGRALYDYIGSPDQDQLLCNLGEFWVAHGLGRLEVCSQSPLTLFVYDCFECAELPLLGRPACAFDLGLLRGIFFAHFGEERAIEEVECYAMGHDHCCFIVADGNP
jgi:predicted hydrocarbon binding protein